MQKIATFALLMGAFACNENTFTPMAEDQEVPETETVAPPASTPTPRTSRRIR